MLRLFAAMIFIAIGSYVGIALSKLMTARVKQLEQCDLLLQRINDYLEYEKTPTKLLIEKLCDCCAFGELKFIYHCKEELLKGVDFPAAWADGIAVSQESMAISAADYEPLIQLGDILGVYDVKSQENGIALLQKRINLQLDSAREESQKTGKLYRSLGMLGGIAVAILTI